MSSDIFGLVVSNIGLKHSRPLLDTLRAELKRCKKKCYTLSVGRINPAKLANFEGVECFVLVGCSEGGLVDSKVRSLTSRGVKSDVGGVGISETDNHTLGIASGIKRS